MPAARLIGAAAAYAGAVFAVGFAMGALRVLALAPWLGAVPAVIAETPVMLAASFLLARRVARRWRAPARLSVRLTIGAVALAILLALELALAAVLPNGTPGAWLARFATPEAQVGLAGQLVFAAMPALLLWRGRQSSSSARRVSDRNSRR